MLGRTSAVSAPETGRPLGSQMLQTCSALISSTLGLLASSSEQNIAHVGCRENDGFPDRGETEPHVAVLAPLQPLERGVLELHSEMNEDLLRAAVGGQIRDLDRRI